MGLKEIIWKTNPNGGKSAYVGDIKIGSYWFNGIDTKNGQYRVSSAMPYCGFDVKYGKDAEHAQSIITTAFEDFIAKISE